VLSAREAAALREALAARQALAAGQTLTPEQIAALRIATSAAKRTATGGPARRTKPNAGPKRKAKAKAKAKKTRPARAPRGEGDRSKWSTRMGVVAMSALLIPAAVAVVLPGSDESGQSGGTDTVSLALTAQTSLLEKAGRYRTLQQEVSARQDELARARAARDAAQTEVAAGQQVVGSTAAELYRAAPAQRLPVLALDVRNPAATSNALYASALAERSEQALEGAVVRA
jgi:hypothetical protein